MTASDAPDRGTVAVVEDDAYVAEALKEWFELMGFQVGVHHSAQSLLACVEPVSAGWLLRHAIPDAPASRLLAVVTDLNMPGMNGFELARRLKGHAPRLPVVVITAASPQVQRQMGGAPAGIACLSKPFDLQELHARLFDTPSAPNAAD